MQSRTLQSTYAYMQGLLHARLWIRPSSIHAQDFSYLIIHAAMVHFLYTYSTYLLLDMTEIVMYFLNFIWGKINGVR